ncbi:MAG: cation transporter [Clostridiales bacterium]|nr:cation transporter [Clostridiales bacterium]
MKQKQKYLLLIEGMSDAHCARHVENALSEISNVKKCVVTLEKGTALVEADAPVAAEQFADAIVEAGYVFAGIK